MDVQTQTVDNVNHPSHYLQHPSGIETITITEHFNFCVGNAIKYLWRSDHKNGLEDLRKARWYIDREITRLTSNVSRERVKEYIVRILGYEGKTLNVFASLDEASALWVCGMFNKAGIEAGIRYE
jgi:hypothetical protein